MMKRVGKAASKTPAKATKTSKSTSVGRGVKASKTARLIGRDSSSGAFTGTTKASGTKSVQRYITVKEFQASHGTPPRPKR